MLLRFGVENMLSMQGYQEISFVVPKASDQKEVKGLHHVPGLREPVVPVTALYGSNASGKSNMLSSLEKFIVAIKKSHDRPGMPLGVRKPFQLEDRFGEVPTRMECDVVVAHERYQYGFVIDENRVREEWLYGFTGARHRVLFHRNVMESEPFYFGPSLKGNNKAIRLQTREDSLFLSSAGTNNHPILMPIWDYFCTAFYMVLDPTQWKGRHAFSIRVLEDSKQLQDQVVAFLREGDTGITGMTIREIPLEERNRLLENVKMPEDMDEDLKEMIIPSKTISLLHRTANSGEVPLRFGLESRGTQIMLGLSVQVMRLLETGGVLVVDELESGLHPLIAQRLVEVFQDPERNPKGAQLIFATHNTQLLNLLAPAQVWLCEKNPQGATEVYPLTAAQPRKGENLERGYLRGRYGGIPLLGPMEEMWPLPPAQKRGA